jgi:hypothetical protein
MTTARGAGRAREAAGGPGGPGPGSDSDSGRESGAGPGSGGRGRDITVHYPDGWVERIRGGLYELIDPARRLVVRRAATAEDRARLLALR